MPDTIPTKPERRFERVREQIHNLNIGVHSLARQLAVPAGVPEDDERDDQDDVDPDDVRDSIIQVRLDEESGDYEEFVA